MDERINNLIRENQIRAVYDENIRRTYGTMGWWKAAYRITGSGVAGIHVAKKYHT